MSTVDRDEQGDAPDATETAARGIGSSASPTRRLPVSRADRPLLPILALFAAMAVAYNLVTPIGESVDESSHLDYVVYLHDEKRLPVLTAEIDQGVHQAAHPPLYYLLGAALTAGMDVEKVRYVHNPDFSFNWDRPVPPPPNIYVHVQDPPFPYRGRPDLQAAHVMRLASLIAGLITLCATWALGRAIAPRERAVAIAATTVVAFVPSFTFFGGMFNNDALLNALAACALLWSVRVVQGHASRRDLVALGTILGLATMTKLTAVALLPIAALAVVVAAWRARDRRLVWRALFAVGLPIALLAGWWVARNMMLYGADDPLGWRIFSARAPELLRSRPLGSELGAYFRFQFVSFWGAFGWANIRLPDLAYRLIAAAVAVSGVGLALFLVRRARALDASQRWSLGLLAATIVVGYAFVFRLVFTFNLSVAQGRYVHFLLPALAVLGALGALELVPRRARHAVAVSLGAALLSLSLYALAVVVPRAYRTPPPVSAAAQARIAHRLDLDIVDRARIVGYDVDAERVHPGDTVSVTIYWSAQQSNWQPFPRTNDSFWVFLHALDGAGEVVARVDAAPFGGRHPVLAWRPGEVIAETYALAVSPAAVAGKGALLVGMYAEGSPDRRLPVAEAGRAVGDAARLEPFVVRPARAVRFDRSLGAPRDDRLDDPSGIRLVGAALPSSAVRAGQTVTLTLYWTADRPIARDYTAFVHLSGAGGGVAATADAPPEAGRYPTSLWAPGEQVADAHPLVVPAGVPPGRYDVAVGLYEPVTGARVPARRGDGERWARDEIVLGTLDVVSP